MEKKIMALFTRTPLHVGAGNSVGAIDSPVQRERHTRIPIIPGSSLKGVLADLWPTQRIERKIKGKDGKEEMKVEYKRTDVDTIWLFGSDDDKNASAGALLIGEARVLAFPVRSAKGSFAWITCPLVLARYKRDSGCTFELPDNKIEESKCIASAGLVLQNKTIFEEYCFEAKTDKAFDSILSELSNVFKDDDIWGSLKERFAIVPDEIFSYFVENACEVVTRIRVNDETGTVDSGALFNQEQVPSETMFYAVIAAQDKKDKPAKDALEKFEEKLKSGVIQVGGDETIGLGYCSVKINPVKKENN